MKSYVITINDSPDSVRVAERCKESGKKFGLDIENFWAITPKNDPIKIAQEIGIPLGGFKEVWSRYENALAAFLSHYSLWLECEKTKDIMLILEHDAVIVNEIPQVFFKGLLSLGKPSYGKFNTSPHLGVNNLFSKPYLPGAHGYLINPAGATTLIKKSKIMARPTDVFLNKNTFPWIQEYYPWPIEARDSFTTIQNENGCRAKHNYNAGYKIL